MKALFRSLAHAVFQSDRVKKRFLAKHCSKIRNKKMLEIGSGKRVNGKLIYSVAPYFRRKKNDVTLTDIKKEYGHKVVDITKSVPKGFDSIICFNVLEHVFESHKAVDKMHGALKKGGQLLVLVPCFYPLHDEPHDYYRYTEHALRRMMEKFSKVEVDHAGVRQYPSYYFVKATK